MNTATSFPSEAEKKASAAEKLPAFSGLSLLHIRRHVTHLLGLIGRDGIFDQYTAHDISHIDKMLKNLDWIIPEDTKKIMSAADWLMTVLAIYFHDLGMLTTKLEYELRDKSDFKRFKEEILFSGAAGQDYKEKVSKLGVEKGERFLYQEFVRSKHAERIKSWVTGKESKDLGLTKEASEVIDDLLKPLGDQFRKDLGLVCESHHLNDLNDRKKYKLSEAYGDSQDETVNIQYCAVLLRTADLLHLTSDRTPSVTFKVVAPTDPISQEEWAKQQAVKRVTPKMGVDEDGNPSERAIKDTIEVYAYFHDENGFFGLTTYLSYCAEQLKQSNQWISNSNKEALAKHQFPWRKIDDQNIQTEGFIRDTYEFAIDQAKILDLLTGHTLYNDTRVVLREVVQNALDAIRLQNYPQPAVGIGKVEIKWHSESRTLSVTDNGTGMTQRFVSDFLLKVGTSRYQDPEFKKQYPEFSSISRFGIGVLSTFMISDSVEIITCHPDDEEARQLTLRSVHGKYLIRLLKKTDDRVANVFPHGTTFKMKLRSSVSMEDPVAVAKMWVVIPGCDVFLKVDDEDPVKIGFDSPAEALAEYLSENGIASELAENNTLPDSPSKPIVKIVERYTEGITLAYAVRWIPYFREWAFLPAPTNQPGRNSAKPPLGISIEGIRVEFQSPGFISHTIAAMANVTGPNAPKTNVARSGLEATPERDQMLRGVYKLYREHVSNEVDSLSQARSYSLTGAVEEGRYLTVPLLKFPVSETLLKEELTKLEVLAIEDANVRRAISADYLNLKDFFWTVECIPLEPAESLIKKAKVSASLAQIVKAIGIEDFDFPEGDILCGVGTNTNFGRFAYFDREVDKIIMKREQLRIDMRWVKKLDTPRWISFTGPVPDFLEHLISDRRYVRMDTSLHSFFVGMHGAEIVGDRVTAVVSSDNTFVMPNTAIAKILAGPMMQLYKDPDKIQLQINAAFFISLAQKCVNYAGKIQESERLVARQVNEWTSVLGEGFVLSSESKNALIDAISEEDWNIFAPSRWSRRNEENDFHGM